MSLDLLKDLHLLTRDGQLNADARRKLKQIRHLLGLLKPALDDAFSRHPEPKLVDCGAGKSYLGFLLHELVIAPAGRGSLLAIESRAELVDAATARATLHGQARMQFVRGSIADAGQVAAGAQVVTALHACDTATDDALVIAIASGAEHIAVVPCCQAELARQLAERKPRTADDEALIAHPIHRREFASHLTNVIRGLCLESHGYKVTITELVGWEHSLKNELILGRRVRRHDERAEATLDQLLERWQVRPTLIEKLRAAQPVRA
jgi:Methyltransferase domain